jgi:hypothetical protein
MAIKKLPRLRSDAAEIPEGTLYPLHYLMKIPIS